MVHTQKTEQMFSRSTLKVFLWLSLFVLQSDSSGTDQEVTVKAKVGGEAKLPCDSTRPADMSLETHFIYWQKYVGNRKKDLFVIGYASGKEETERTEEQYKNRTKMNEQNLTLSISPVKVSDEGTYTCLIIKDGKKGEGRVNLSVVADFSKPVIDIPDACSSTHLTLTCFSHGGYPKPKMLGSINNKTVKWDVVPISDNDTALINVTGHRQLNMTEEIFVQCSVVYAGFEESANLTWSRRKACILPAQPPPYGIIIASSVILVFLVVVLAVVLRQFTCKDLRSSHPVSSFQPVATIEMAPQQQVNGTSGASF